MNQSDFNPFLLLRSASLQTILPTVWPLDPIHVDEWLQVELSDGDALKLAINFPDDRVGKGLVVIVHGLTGSSESNYNVRLAKKLTGAGYVVCRCNLRGSGEGKGLAKKTYHAGQTKDFERIIETLAERFSLPFYPIGFSLGGNLVLKYLGEQGSRIPAFIRAFLMVSPPFDLKASAFHLKKDHHLWDRYFVRLMINSVEELHQMFPELGSYHFPTKCSLYDFDDIYTAPRHGFGTAEKYYAESSSGQFLKAIEIPGLILAAQDDPIVSYESCPEMGAKTKLVLSRYGGHCGFVGKPNHSFFWLDDYLFRWLEEHSQG